MRFADTVFFVKAGKSQYNESTGDYETSGSTKESRSAHVNDMSREMMELAFGAIKKGALTVRVKTLPIHAYDWVEVKGVKYRDVDVRKLRGKMIFHLEEMA